MNKRSKSSYNLKQFNQQVRGGNEKQQNATERQSNQLIKRIQPTFLQDQLYLYKGIKLKFDEDQNTNQIATITRANQPTQKIRLLPTNFSPPQVQDFQQSLSRKHVSKFMSKAQNAKRKTVYDQYLQRIDKGNNNSQEDKNPQLKNLKRQNVKLKNQIQQNIQRLKLVRQKSQKSLLRSQSNGELTKNSYKQRDQNCNAKNKLEWYEQKCRISRMNKEKLARIV